MKYPVPLNIFNDLSQSIDPVLFEQAVNAISYDKDALIFSLAQEAQAVLLNRDEMEIPSGSQILTCVLHPLNQQSVSALLNVFIAEPEATVYFERFHPEAPFALYIITANALNEAVLEQLKSVADISLQSAAEFLDKKQLILFDMDSTLIQAEVIDELAKEVGIVDQVSAITESAMRGEIDFTESFTKRIGLLKGLKAELLDGVTQRIEFTKGAEILLPALKQAGMTTALVSGGFTYFAEQFAAILGMDSMHANILEFEQGELTGQPVLPILDSNRKAEILAELAEINAIDTQQSVAVGDGANDIPMMQKASLGIAFCAKPRVQDAADWSINQSNLAAVYYFFNK